MKFTHCPKHRSNHCHIRPELFITEQLRASDFPLALCLSGFEYELLLWEYSLWCLFMCSSIEINSSPATIGLKVMFNKVIKYLSTEMGSFLSLSASLSPALSVSLPSV